MEQKTLYPDYKVLPTDYAIPLKEDDEKFENEQRNLLEALKSEKENEYYKKVRNLDKKIEKTWNKEFGTYMGMMMVIAGAILCIIALIECIPEFSREFAKAIQWWKILELIIELIIAMALCGGLLVFFGGGILGIVLSPICYPIYRGICNSKQKKINFQRNEIIKEQNRAIKKIVKTIDDNIEQRHKATENRIKQYTEGFEQEAKKKSIDFANSMLAKEVIQWLTDGFLKTVKAANRAHHIEKIVVPFDFIVKQGEISCNIGRYNFEEHRCEKLSDVLEQAALARAIASQIQLNLRTQYSEDNSGTKYKIDITYKYPEPLSSKRGFSSLEDTDFVIAQLTYTAPNGNYKPIQKW